MFHHIHKISFYEFVKHLIPSWRQFSTGGQLLNMLLVFVWFCGPSHVFIFTGFIEIYKCEYSHGLKISCELIKKITETSRVFETNPLWKLDSVTKFFLSKVSLVCKKHHFLRSFCLTSLSYIKSDLSCHTYECVKFGTILWYNILIKSYF